MYKTVEVVSVKVVWGMFAGQEGEIIAAYGNKNIVVKLTNGLQIELSRDHVEEIPSRKFAVGQAVRIDGTAFEVVGFDEVKNRYLVSRLNPCNGKVRKGAKPVGYSENRIKGWNE